MHAKAKQLQRIESRLLFHDYLTLLAWAAGQTAWNAKWGPLPDEEHVAQERLMATSFADMKAAGIPTTFCEAISEQGKRYRRGHAIEAALSAAVQARQKGEPNGEWKEHNS